MIEWRDEGAVLSVRMHGETSVIAEVFTASHGRFAGMVRGGTGRKLSSVLQPGGQVEVVWKARLEDHLGTFTVEPLRSRAAAAMADRQTLAGLGAVVSLLSLVLPEREAHPQFYLRTMALLDLLEDQEVWPFAYLQWEVSLLEELGFGLDLSRCAVTGLTEDLAYVSPRTGRAVSRGAAGEWVDRLLPLPPVLLGQGDAGAADIVAALAVTGHFIEHRLLYGIGDRPVPMARSRLIAALLRQS
jgi:DNA repair protein RecO (recombination protein O)